MDVTVRGTKGTVVGASNKLTLTLDVANVNDDAMAFKKLKEWGFVKEPKPNLGKASVEAATA